MKKRAFIAGLILFSPLAFSATDINALQDLCAKEKDPLRRQYYCTFLDDASVAGILPKGWRRDSAIV